MKASQGRMNTANLFRQFLGDPVVRKKCFHCWGLVAPLVRELRFCKLYGVGR